MAKPPTLQQILAEKGIKQSSSGFFVPGSDPAYDPAELIRQMKVEEQDREQIRRMRRDAGEEYDTPRTRFAETEIKPRSLAAGTYDGAGGYKYEVMSSGAIKIVDAPSGRGVGTTLNFGHPAHEAIYEELSSSGQQPASDPRAEEQSILDDMMASKARREADAAEATGVSASETSPSGREMARVLGMNQEEQKAELARTNAARNTSEAKLSGPTKVALSSGAKQAFDRTKAKLAERS